MERLTTRCAGHAVMAWEHEEQHTTQEWIDMLTDRLAAYEDVGLEPEEVADLLIIHRGMAGNEYVILDDELRSILFAKNEGRLLVLPCKVGDTVYRLYSDCDFPGDCLAKRTCKGCEYRNMFIEEHAFCISMLYQNGTLGKPYFLTREEAEAALKGEQAADAG